jgi:tRNA threonylcarbamoyladenosine biosynthesis protein TsaB
MVVGRRSMVIMALILHIETATSVCSVALAEDGKLLSLKEENKANTHAEKITLFISDVLEEAGKKIQDLNAVAVSSGPGSYTGLRIGVSTAKGLCYALDKPLIAINSLKGLANSIRNSQLSIDNSLLVPMIDARRMEVYCAVYDSQLDEIEKTAAKIIDTDSFAHLLKEKKIYFFGDGAEKCKPFFLKNNNAVFMDTVFSSAGSMIALAYKKFQQREFEDVGLFEPFYLKEFMDSKKNNPQG